MKGMKECLKILSNCLKVEYTINISWYSQVQMLVDVPMIRAMNMQLAPKIMDPIPVNAIVVIREMVMIAKIIVMITLVEWTSFASVC